MAVYQTAQISIRLRQLELDEIDTFAKDHDMDRSEAIRLLVARGLHVDDSPLTDTDRALWESAPVIRSLGSTSIPGRSYFSVNSTDANHG